MSRISSSGAYQKLELALALDGNDIAMIQHNMIIESSQVKAEAKDHILFPLIV